MATTTEDVKQHALFTWLNNDPEAEQFIGYSPGKEGITPADGEAPYIVFTFPTRQLPRSVQVVIDDWRSECGTKYADRVVHASCFSLPLPSGKREHRHRIVFASTAALTDFVQWLINKRLV